MESDARFFSSFQFYVEEINKTSVCTDANVIKISHFVDYWSGLLFFQTDSDMSRGQLLRRSARSLNYCTLWLDARINKSDENRRAQETLRMFVKYLLLFADQESCLQYIQSLSSEYPIILIVSAELGQSIVPEISHLQNVVAIYVFCSDKQQHDLWTRHYYKVIEVDHILQTIQEQIELF